MSFDREWQGIDALQMPLAFKDSLTIRVVPDVFAEYTDKQLDQVFAVMALTPQHTYQVLTKRPERMLEYMDWCERRHNAQGKPTSFCRVDAVEAVCRERENYPHYDIPQWPLPNVWLGVTVENQATADERIPLLLQTPAAVRFLSCEPLLEKVNFRSSISKSAAKNGTALFKATERSYVSCPIDWVIVGGESGPGARPCDIEWIRSIVEQCKAAGVACFFKQLGSKCYGMNHGYTGKGNNPDEWPADLRVRQIPSVEVKA